MIFCFPSVKDERKIKQMSRGYLEHRSLVVFVLSQLPLDFLSGVTSQVSCNYLILGNAFTSAKLLNVDLSLPRRSAVWELKMRPIFHSAAAHVLGIKNKPLDFSLWMSVGNHTFCRSTEGSIKLNQVNCLQLDGTVWLTGIHCVHECQRMYCNDVASIKGWFYAT